MKMPFWMILLGWVVSSGVWADDSFSVPLYDPITHQDVPAPGQPTFTMTPAVTATPTATFSPSLAQVTATPSLGTTSSATLSTPLNAPQWSEVKTTPRDLPINKKISPWMSLLGVGADIPASSNIQKGYAVGFDLDLGTGYRLDDRWSLWINLELGQFTSRNDALTQNNNFLMIEAAFWARYRITGDDFSPYLFAGPGLAYNENRNNQAALYDPVTGYYNVPVNQSEVDFVAEGGLGLDLKTGEGFHVFLQGKVISDFTSPHFAHYASTDSPIVLVPVELGVLFGY
jgi:hypothetical protein